MFITFEGIGGTGKTTQITKLREHLEQLGHRVLVTREPGGSQLGEQLRSYILYSREEVPVPLAELLLFMADRAEHVAKVIKPALDVGMTVISDRFIDSSVAYQAGGNGLSLLTVKQLNNVSASGVLPDLTILLDMPVETALNRVRLRDKRTDRGLFEGRFTEKALAFHQRVRDAYLAEVDRHLAASATSRFRVVDADRDPLEIHWNICQLVDYLLKERA